MIVNTETRYMTGGIFRAIEPGKKLAFTWGAVDGWPKINPEQLELAPHITILFHEVPDGTQMVFRLELPDQLTEPQTAEWMSSGMLAGWTMTIDRLKF
ncbi:hypothetical protein D3C87_1866020 [compost metagenome]